MQLLYATFATKEEALAVARVLLDEKLIACANVVGGATSLYRWEGKVEEKPEAMMFAKTARAQEAVARIKILHSYELPCVLVLPVESGNAAFMQWVETQST